MEELVVLGVVGFVLFGRALEWLGLWVDGKTREALRYPQSKRRQL